MTFRTSRTKTGYTVDDSIDLFADLDQGALAVANRLLTTVDVPAGTLLGRQGTIGREFLIVLEGHVAVEVDSAPIALVTPGGHFGEVALLDRANNPRRRAGFHALGRCRVAVAGRAEFAGLLRLSPLVDQRIRARATRRRAYLDALDRNRELTAIAPRAN